jgi:hypothetical protein
VDLFTPAALPDHHACGSLCLEHRALQIDVDDVVELRLGRVFGFLLAIESDAVDEDVDASEMPGYVFDHRARLVDRQRVEDGRVGAGAERLGAGRGLGGVLTGDRDTRAGLNQTAADGDTDAAVAAGDEGDLPAKLKWVSPGVRHRGWPPLEPAPLTRRATSPAGR